MALGCRFTDWSASSCRKGITFSIPEAKLIHFDIDPREIGNNYPAEVGIAADCKLVLADILAGISDDQARKTRESRSAYLYRLKGLKMEWERRLEPRRSFGGIPTSIQRTLRELRKVLPRNGIVTVGPGHRRTQPSNPSRVRTAHTHHFGVLLQHGLRTAGCHRRKAGQARYAGGLHQRRRRLHDVHSGTGPPSDVQHSSLAGAEQFGIHVDP
jgi:thiamine pyrophosphate-dependent acetolactate synthase large subunit-like protein